MEHPPSSVNRLRSGLIAIAAIAICTAVGAGIGYRTSRMQGAQYRAEAQLMVQMGREVSSQRPELIMLGDAQRIVAPGWREYVNTELSILRHPSIKEMAEEAAKEALGRKGEKSSMSPPTGIRAGVNSALSLEYEADESEGRIGKDRFTFNAVNVPRSNILRLECICGNGEMAKLLLTKWIEVYKTFHLKVHGQGALLNLFEAETKRANDDYLKAEAEMAKFCAETGFYDFDDDRAALVQEERRLELDQQRANLEIADLTAQIAELEKHGAEGASAALVQLRADLSGAKARAAALATNLEAARAQLQELDRHRGRHEVLASQIESNSGVLARAVSAERLCRASQRLDEAGVMNVSVISEPSVQPTPVTVMGFPHRVGDTLLGGVFGFVLAAGVLLVVHALREAGLLLRRRRPGAAA
jgi:uncharacterized protein involved in exopolysaccharide biosynthesis